MKLFDILKQQGIFSSDIRVRIKNKQIFINGNIVESDVELDVELDENGVAEIFETGRIICDLIVSIKGEIFSDQMKMIGFENIFNSNIDSDLTRILNKFIFVKLSKKENFLLRICQK